MGGNGGILEGGAMGGPIGVWGGRSHWAVWGRGGGPIGPYGAVGQTVSVPPYRALEALRLRAGGGERAERRSSGAVPPPPPDCAPPRPPPIRYGNGMGGGIEGGVL